MTSPKAQRRRSLETIWLLRITVFLLLAFAGYQILVVNPQTDETQVAIKETQAQQVKATRQVHRLAEHNHAKVLVITRSLCALRAELEKRVEQTTEFLKRPEDFPQFNDPKVIALTEQQVEGQRRTITALRILNCKRFK